MLHNQYLELTIEVCQSFFISKGCKVMDTLKQEKLNNTFLFLISWFQEFINLGLTYTIANQFRVKM